MPQFETRARLRTDLDTFTRAYLECALWTMTDAEGNDCDDFDGELSDDAYACILSDCGNFQTRNSELLRQADKLGEDDARAGHDFWLTRNGHGAGFWDRGLGETGAKLSDAARSFGECDAYIGDDGKVYLS